MIPLQLFEEKDNAIEELVASIKESPTKYQYIVFFSGGKDSTATVLYLLELGVSPSQIHLHHHDIDGHGPNVFDWPCTPSYVKAFSFAMKMPLFFSYREGGIMGEIFRNNEGLQDVLYQNVDGDQFHRLESQKGSSTRLKFPAVAASLTTRWCSAVVKIDVGSRVIANHPAYQNKKNLVVITGERRQESAGRSKYKEAEMHRTSGKARRVIHWRPIIDWKEEQVWSIMERWNIQPHPAYMLGWSRCSCATCIFSSPNTWASLYELDKEYIERLVNIEETIGHTMFHNGKKGVSIMEKALQGKSFLQEENVRRWKEEALGEFMSPIITNKWILPQGAYGKENSGSV